ncbi:MAG: DNA gyrase inhibitor YacG [Burkholderiaceae bacterium]
MQARKTRTVACPTCKGDSVYDSANPFRPFCSERCKNIDFGAWAEEDFRLAANPDPDLDLDQNQDQDQTPNPPLQ